MFELIFPGWLAGAVLSIVTSSLGSFIVCRKMSSFGDTLSHSSLFGLSISFILHINSFFVIFCFISLLAFILAWLKDILPFSLETLLSIISYSSMSLGMIIMSLIPPGNQSLNVKNYLFGDLLSVTRSDLIIMILVSLIILIILIYRWNSMLLATIHEELATIDGINIFYARLTIMLMTSLAISMAVKFVGVLLITALLIIPPTTAQIFSKSPEQMVIISIFFSIISVTGGIFFSVFFNIPTSPSIVLCSSVLFLLGNLKKIIF